MNKRAQHANVNLTEIEDQAAITATFWLEQATQAADNELSDKARAPAAVAGYEIAAALYYHAERLTDAASMIADAIREAGRTKGGDAK